ncbi:MAG: Wzz/FepE/Etk N-terminal domain-containing protein [Verrucomicrobia bacterium]|nr:Wzz/FepE/Etk N-terminal domain-containing protein [Verrucomicrobiota bacterium]
MNSAPTTPANAKPQPRRHSSLNVYDILFVLFKHKWKIIFFALVGIAAAAAVVYRDTRSPIYETQAKLLVRYVVDRNSVDKYDTKADAGGNRGVEVMDAEIEIIKSSDVALEVATKIGPEKILTAKDTPPSNAAAAVQIMKSLGVTATRGSSVIHLTYSHPDPAVAVAVLKQLIDTYFEKHLEIHRSTGAFESVARQTELARSRLSQTELELSKLSVESGFLSLADAKTALEARRNAMRSSLLAAQVELAEQQVKVASLSAAMGVLEPEAPKSDPEQAEEATPERMARVKAQDRYRDLTEQLALFKQRRNSLMMSRKPGDPMLVALDRQIATTQQQGLDLVEQYPGLAAQTKGRDGDPSPLAPGTDLNAERATLESLGAKCKMLTEQVAKVDAEVAKISSSSLEFANLERRRQLEEEKYRYFETSLEKARVDEALNPASMPNIGVVQSPSAPAKSLPAATIKLALGLAAGGLLVGLAFAFLIEWVIDRRVSRPIEIQTRLQLPLMMTIPRIRSKDGVAKLISHDSSYKLLGDNGELILSPVSSNGDKPAKYEPEHFIMPYAGALRDRIMFGFEISNITHKPKLIGLTGLSLGAGASTLAIAMANAFAENGKCKVLLVDLNSSWSAGLPEAPVESLHTALAVSRTAAFRQHPRSLYFASAPTRRSGKGAQSLASAAMHELMPQLGVCDFDYIVFDMPPVGPTSPTLAMAGFMDKVLLVLDAENTNRESLSWSYGELAKGRADVSCVFNKTKSVAPRWVAGEL